LQVASNKDKDIQTPLAHPSFIGRWYTCQSKVIHLPNSSKAELPYFQLNILLCSPCTSLKTNKKPEQRGAPRPPYATPSVWVGNRPLFLIYASVLFREINIANNGYLTSHVTYHRNRNRNNHIGDQHAATKERHDASLEYSPNQAEELVKDELQQ
jgi:hypothetical protein